MFQKFPGRNPIRKRGLASADSQVDALFRLKEIILRKVNAKVILLISLVAGILLLPYGYLSLQVNKPSFVIYEFLAKHIMGNPEVVFTGDSITYCGYIWAFRINNYYLTSSNIAISGIGMDKIKDITLRAIKNKPKYIFIMGGRNDMPANYEKGNAQSTIATYKQILDAAVKNDIKVFVTSTLYRADEQNPQIIDELNTFLKEYCTENGQVYIDLNAKLSVNGKLRKDFTFDNMHINDKAYKIWAEMIKSELKRGAGRVKAGRTED